MRAMTVRFDPAAVDCLGASVVYPLHHGFCGRPPHLLRDGTFYGHKAQARRVFGDCACRHGSLLIRLPLIERVT